MGNWNSGRRPNAGARPTPTRLKILRGNPGKRPLNPNEPQITTAPPAFDEPPPELAGDEAAQQEWRRVVPQLRAMRIIGESDRAALLALCQQWSQYLECHGKVRTLGLVVKKPSGLPMINPYLAAADAALARCRALWVELGLTPSARAKLSALPDAEPQESNKWAGLL